MQDEEKDRAADDPESPDYESRLLRERLELLDVFGEAALKDLAEPSVSPEDSKKPEKPAEQPDQPAKSAKPGKAA